MIFCSHKARQQIFISCIIQLFAPQHRACSLAGETMPALEAMVTWALPAAGCAQPFNRIAPPVAIHVFFGMLTGSAGVL